MDVILKHLTIVFCVLSAKHPVTQRPKNKLILCFIGAKWHQAICFGIKGRKTNVFPNTIQSPTSVTSGAFVFVKGNPYQGSHNLRLRAQQPEN